MSLPSIKISLGLAAPEEYHRMITLSGVPTVRIDEHMAWSALNRVFDMPEDLDRLAREYPNERMAQILRTELEAAKAPSMSVGDEIRWYSAGGVLIRHLRVASVGWDVLDVPNPFINEPITPKVKD